MWKTDGAITQIFTDAGIVGIGEGSPYEGPDYIKEITEKEIKPLLVGRNPSIWNFIGSRKDPEELPMKTLGGF